MTSSSAPGAVALSVVVVRFVGDDGITRTLEALAPQLANLAGEVVVAHRRENAPSAAMLASFPAVRWVACDHAPSPATLRAEGVRASAGGIVACTEDHCVPAPDWCARVLQAHNRMHAIVGGAIDKVPTASAPAWVAYLLDYARYMSPLPAGPADHASDCNVSYRRSDLDDVADAWQEEFHETTVQWSLGARGVTVQLDPSIVVQQHREIALDDYLQERREHGRTYATTRMAGASPVTRARFAATALLLAPVLVLRVRAVLAERHARGMVPRGAWGPLVRAAAVWSAGEWDGYVGRR